MADVVALQQINQIAKMLLDIKKSNGYLSDVREVNKEEVSIENIKQFIAVNIITAITDYSNPELSDAGKHVKTMNVVLDCYLRGKENKQKNMLNFLADLEIRFGDNTPDGNPAFSQTATAYNLENKALIVIFNQAIPFSVEGEKHIFGIEFLVEVKFRQSMVDPTVLN